MCTVSFEHLWFKIFTFEPKKWADNYPIQNNEILRSPSHGAKELKKTLSSYWIKGPFIPPTTLPAPPPIHIRRLASSPGVCNVEILAGWRQKGESGVDCPGNFTAGRRLTFAWNIDVVFVVGNLENTAPHKCCMIRWLCEHPKIDGRSWGWGASPGRMRRGGEDFWTMEIILTDSSESERELSGVLPRSSPLQNYSTKISVFP